MAMVLNKLSTVLQLKVKTTDAKGNDVTRLDSYRGVKTEALDEGIYAVAAAIGSVKKTPIVSVIKNESYEMINQA